MDTRFLQSFLYVVETGSIAGAARRLDLTPASVAQRIKALEAELGSTLIRRSGRTVQPTLAGSRILERSKRVLDELRDLRSVASDTHMPAGPLRLGATPTGLVEILPPVLRQWVQTYPTVEVYIEPAQSTVLYQRVLDNHLDAAILVNPLFELPKTLGWKRLRTERLILLTPAGMVVRDPLATLENEPYIRYDRGVVAGKLAEDYLHHHNVRPHVRFELDGIESIAKLVAEGLGVSVLPDWLVTEKSHPVFKRWPLPAPHLEREVGVIWTRANVRAQLAQALVDMALVVCDSESG